MKLPFDYKSNDMPWSNLQAGFKSRLIQLAPTAELPKLTETCPDIRTRCLRRFKVYNCVFITDKGLLLKAALDEMKTDIFIQKVVNYASFYKCTRYIYDGPVTFDQRWDSAVYGDALNLTKPIYVGNSLILHCRNKEVYEAVIPCISGSYSRLVIYGEITWDQFKRLLHGNVKQVRIEGKIDVDPSQYDDVVEFIQGFCRGFMYKFSFRTKCFKPLLVRKLKEACKSHSTHKLVCFLMSDYSHIIHKNYRICFFVITISFFVLNVLMYYLAVLYFIPNTMENLTPYEDKVGTILELLAFVNFLLHCDFTFNFIRSPTDRIVVRNTNTE